MIKLTMLAKRKANLSYQEFDQYWQKHHAQLVKSLQKPLNIIRYVQTVPHSYPILDHTIQTNRQSQAFNFDGMAEIWWESLESMQKNRQSLEAIAALKTLFEDEKQFVDHSHSVIWYSTERLIITDQI